MQPSLSKEGTVQTLDFYSKLSKLQAEHEHYL